MAKAFLIMRHELSVTLRRPSFIIFSMAVPVLALVGLVALFVYQTAIGDRPEDGVTAGVVDLTRGPSGEPMFTGFREYDTVTFELVPDVETGTRRLLDDDLDRLYVIPADYLATGLINEVKLQQAGIGNVSDASGNPNVTPLGRFLLNNLFVGNVGPELSERVLRPYVVAVTEIDESGNVIEEPLDPGKLIFFMVLSILLVISVLTTSGYLLQGLNEEKENRIMEILLSSAKPEHLMLGKLFGLGSAGLIQMLIWISSGIVVLIVLRTSGNLPDSLNLSTSIPAIAIGAVYFILGYFLFGTLMAALGAITTSQREAGQVTFLVVLPGVVPMWFIGKLIEQPEGLAARVLSFIPFSAPSASLVRLGVNGMGPLDLAISLAILAGSVAGAMWLTIRLFRAYLLMYGQRPGLRQILATLRHP